MHAVRPAARAGFARARGGARAWYCFWAESFRFEIVEPRRIGFFGSTHPCHGRYIGM